MIVSKPQNMIYLAIPTLLSIFINDGGKHTKTPIWALDYMYLEECSECPYSQVANKRKKYITSLFVLSIAITLIRSFSLYMYWLLKWKTSGSGTWKGHKDTYLNIQSTTVTYTSSLRTNRVPNSSTLYHTAKKGCFRAGRFWICILKSISQAQCLWFKVHHSFQKWPPPHHKSKSASVKTPVKLMLWHQSSKLPIINYPLYEANRKCIQKTAMRAIIFNRRFVPVLPPVWPTCIRSLTLRPTNNQG